MACAADISTCASTGESTGGSGTASNVRIRSGKQPRHRKPGVGKPRNGFLPRGRLFKKSCEFVTATPFLDTTTPVTWGFVFGER